jgi:2EXR family
MATEESVNPPTSEITALPTETQQRVVVLTLRPRRGKNFLLFPKLAFEIRDMIFKFTAEDLDSNIVKIYLSNPEDDPSNSQPEIRASYKVPALLKVNRQARDVTKKTYPLVFSRPLRGKRIFFNVSKDILYFEGNPNWELSWQNTLYLFSRPLTWEDTHSSYSDADTGADTPANTDTDAALIHKQVRFMILHPAGRLSSYEARDALEGEFHNLEGAIIVKDKLRLNRLGTQQARFSSPFIANTMARFWETERLHRMVEGVPCKKPLITCLTKPQLSKKVMNAMNAKYVIKVLIDYRTFSIHSDC